MEMTLRDCLHEASMSSMLRDMTVCGRADPDETASVELPREKIEALSRKILFLPHEGVCVLLARYCFELSCADTEQFYGVEDAKGRFRFYRKLLSSCMGLGEKELISDASLKEACGIVMNEYLKDEAAEAPEAEDSGKVVPMRGGRRIRTIGRALLIAALLATLLLGMLMAVSAKVRERVVNWFVEEHKEYSVFEVKQDVDRSLLDPRDYTFTYLPEGAELVDSFDVVDFTYSEYEVNGKQSVKIMICTANKKVYVNTENAEVHELQLGALEGYWFAKDDLKYVCFEMDDFYFSVYGTADIDELFKVAGSVTRVERAAFTDPRSFSFAYLPEGAELIDTILDDDFADYGYEVNGTQELDITICPAHYRVYVDTEDAELHELQIGDMEGYWFFKDDLNYVCFVLEGCQFSISGTVDISELFKVAESVTKSEDAFPDPQGYTFAYLPQGMNLANEMKGSFYADYRYETEESEQYIDVLICPEDQRVYVDTENAELHELQIGDQEGYWFAKDDLNYVCFAMDGCQFSICGTVEIGKLFKFAGSVMKTDHMAQSPLDFTLTYLPKNAKRVDAYDDGYYIEYEYDAGGRHLDIMIFPAGQRINVDSEGAEIHPLQIGDKEGYWFSKDTLRYVCFAMDGYQFSLSGTVDVDELMKVASGITRRSGSLSPSYAPRTENSGETVGPVHDTSLKEWEIAADDALANIPWVRRAQVTLMRGSDGKMEEVLILVDADEVTDARCEELISAVMREVPGVDPSIFRICDMDQNDYYPLE